VVKALWGGGGGGVGGLGNAPRTLAERRRRGGRERGDDKLNVYIQCDPISIFI